MTPGNTQTASGGTTSGESRGATDTALTWTGGRKALVAAILVGCAAIAAIGFAGSYTAVRDLAEEKGFGEFSAVFPIGVDVGIVVLLALDLLLTWMAIPFAALRHIAWLLTGATVVFNAAASWPDRVGTAMHAVIPVLFIAVVEAARHAVGRLGDMTSGRRMDTVRRSRWLLSPVTTFRIWRRMHLWELRSYAAAIEHERRSRVYREFLRVSHGTRWRSKASPTELMPLRLAHLGEPIDDALLAQAATALGMTFAKAPSVIEPVGPVYPEAVTEAPGDVPAQADHGIQDAHRVVPDVGGRHPEAVPAPRNTLADQGRPPVRSTSEHAAAADDPSTPTGTRPDTPVRRTSGDKHRDADLHPAYGTALACEYDGVDVQSLQADGPLTASPPAEGTELAVDRAQRPAPTSAERVHAAAEPRRGTTVAYRPAEPEAVPARVHGPEADHGFAVAADPATAATRRGAGDAGGQAPADPGPVDHGDSDDEDLAAGDELDEPDTGQLTKKELARRIYLDHKQAGKPLTRAQLGKMVGYAKPGSARTVYLDLERKYGPIDAADGTGADLGDDGTHDEAHPH